MTLKNIYPICVSLSEANAEKTIALGRKFPFVEVRLDLGSFSPDKIRPVFKSLKNSIVTCRPGRYGDDLRLQLLSSAINSGARYVDVEIESAAKFKSSVISQAKKKKARSILSYHNFERTPGKKVLDSIIKKAKRGGADIVKIATHVRNKADSKVLLSLFADHDNLVVVGMGEVGKSVRIASPLLGGLFTFAAPSLDKLTAAGQLDFYSLKDIYDKLGLLNK